MIKVLKSVSRSMIFVSLVFWGISTTAQLPQQAAGNNYSEQELEKFAHAVIRIMQIQEESQLKMVVAIEENNLSIERFNEMLQEGQQKGGTEISATADEMEAFNGSIQDVQEIQQEMQFAMMDAITQQGLDVEKYQGILQAYEQDPAVKEKIDSYFATME